MREEGKKSVTKLKFKRLMRKKWLYPALYLSVAALVLVGVFWYQQSGKEVENQLANQSETEVQDEFTTQDSGEASVPVMEQNENLQMPVVDEEAASIVTKFYDYNASQEDQESALVLYNNKYYQSEGVDITREDGEAFEVTAALSGTVTEVKEDPLYGNVIEITHDEDVSTVYASLADIKVQAGSEVTQGDVLGSAGQNSFGQASGVHVHFELRNEGQPVNPESFFGQPSSKISEEVKEEAEAEKETEVPSAEDDSAPAEDSAEEPEVSDEPNDEELNTDEDPADNTEGEQTPDEDSASSISTTQT
ncbi:stage II sporulation protein SpoIIQ [Halobacillus halophilus]|uniref:Stage II sporulation protein SpoIIQ n=2 Tax=Halobacillus halophilus TaxID=1570 RepID=I0JS07_HALH3|nr:stage II sporulation protein SpoIIQ [Halobacillus halophilus]CCG46928.1 Stage II sporulation protein SpoIIQ [Halobacillus halophilus DSM 2266]